MGRRWIPEIIAMDKIYTLFAKYGEHDYLGESVSQKSHLIQTAMLAEEAGASPELIAAAFLHDVGQFVGMELNLPTISNLGIRHHEAIGAEFLRYKGFPEYVVNLVGEHVNAKRYLVAANLGYYQRLSEASKQTLALQGGPMNDEACLAFENYDFFKDILRLRSWDELAKRTDLKLKPLEYYVGLCRKILIADNCS